LKIVSHYITKLDGTCKYANSCTFAHGDQELRQKNDNPTNSFGDNNQQNFGYQNPNMNFDPSNPMFMQMMMMNQGGQFQFPMNMMNPGIFI
jgi:hypothetical protein